MFWPQGRNKNELQTIGMKTEFSKPQERNPQFLANHRDEKHNLLKKLICHDTYQFTRFVKNLEAKKPTNSDSLITHKSK